MDKIAIVGQNEMQGAIQSSFAYVEGAGITPGNVNGTVGTPDVTNDKGLTVGKVSDTGVLRGLSPVAKHEIGAPSVPQGKVGGLLKNVVKTFNSDDQSIVDEREIVRLQDENDNAMQESSFKRNLGVQQGAAKKFGAQLISLRQSVNNMPSGTDAGEKAGQAVGVAGAAVGFAAALIVTIVTGGGGIAALVAASVGLASSVTEISGGYAKMQEAISEALQKDHPDWTKAECDRVASIITVVVQVAIEIAETVVSLKAPNPQKQLSGALNALNKSTDGDKIRMLGSETAKQVFNVTNPTQNQIKTVITQAGRIGTFDKPLKYTDMGIKLAGLVVDIVFQKINMDKGDKSNEIQANLELTQADHEQILNILADCGMDFNRVDKRIASQSGKMERILSSQSTALSDINEITSNIGG